MCAAYGAPDPLVVHALAECPVTRSTHEEWASSHYSCPFAEDVHAVGTYWVLYCSDLEVLAQQVTSNEACVMRSAAGLNVLPSSSDCLVGVDYSTSLHDLPSGEGEFQ